MKNYLVIENNVVTNSVVWDGETSWTPPNGSTVVPQDTTLAMVWVLVDDDYELVNQIGQGQIGFTWDGTRCITDEVKPKPIVQPQTNAQEI